MNLITIKHESCKKDGLCRSVCPVNIINDDKNSYPEIKEELESICLNCGQCVAICPHGAIKHKNVPIEKLEKVDKIQTQQIESVIKNRRSIRKYKKESVPKEIFSEMLDIARYAPTGGNGQPVNWTIIYEREKIDRLVEIAINWMRDMIQSNSEHLKMIPMDYFVNAYANGVDRITYGAPHIVIAHADEKNPAAPLDCSIALSYFEITANTYELGTCWAGAFDLALQLCEELRKKIGLPQGHKNFGTMLVGYSQYKYNSIPGRKELNINWV